jgi:hypothetical protein
MTDLVRYRAMESLCRQSAVFHPLDSWRLLAQAEMWHHKAEQEIELHSMLRHGAPAATVVRMELPGSAGNPGQPLAG